MTNVPQKISTLRSLEPVLVTWFGKNKCCRCDSVKDLELENYPGLWRISSLFAKSYVQCCEETGELMNSAKT